MKENKSQNAHYFRISTQPSSRMTFSYENNLKRHKLRWSPPYFLNFIFTLNHLFLTSQKPFLFLHLIYLNLLFYLYLKYFHIHYIYILLILNLSFLYLVFYTIYKISVLNVANTMDRIN